MVWKEEEEKLKENIQLNPLNESLYFELIDLYSNNISYEQQQQQGEQQGEEEKEEESIQNKINYIRQQYFYKFIPKEEFWLSWITDTVISINNNLLKPNDIQQIFELAFSNCPTINITSEYIDIMSRFYDDELISESEMRTAFERAVTICGLDVYDGASIWSRYREFELNELEDILELESPESTVQEAKKRLINVFRRQLIQPLDGNEDVLTTLDECLSEVCVEKDVDIINPSSISTAFQSGIELREVRLPFEDNIRSNQFNNLSVQEKTSRWLVYIEFELKDNQIFRAQRLYERALMDCYESSTLWESYVYFALNKVKNWTLLDSILNRCLKNKTCQQNIELWKIRYLSIELIYHPNEIHSNLSQFTPTSDNFLVCSNQIYTIFQNSLQVNFPNKIYYFLSMKMYCNYFKRYLAHLVSIGALESDLFLALTNLWGSMDYIEQYLISYYNDWFEGWLLYITYRVRVEDGLIDDISSNVDGKLDNNDIQSKSQIVWERVIERFPKNYILWKSYIQWSINTTKDISITRKLFKRAMAHLDDTLEPFTSINPHSDLFIITVDHSKLINPQEEFLTQWIEYEEENGTCSDILPLLIKWNKQSYNLDKIINNKNNSQQLTSSTNTNSVKSKKRPISTSETTSTPSSSNQSFTKDSYSAKKLKQDNLDNTQSTEENDQKNQQNSLNQNSIFVKNLSFNATEESLRDAFKECGEIVKVEIVLSKAGKSRGMAEIYFNSHDSVEKAFTLQNHLIMNRPVVIEILDEAAKKKLSINTSNNNNNTKSKPLIQNETQDQETNNEVEKKKTPINSKFNLTSFKPRGLKPKPKEESVQKVEEVVVPKSNSDFRNFFK